MWNKSAMEHKTGALSSVMNVENKQKQITKTVKVRKITTCKWKTTKTEKFKHKRKKN